MPSCTRNEISRAVLLSLAALLGGGCGSSAEWTPPPVSVIPALPASEEGSAADAPASTAEEAHAAPPSPSPIAGDLPDDIDTKLAANASCAQKECAIPGLYPPSPVIDGKAPAAVWSHDIAAQGNAVTFPKHSGVDIYGVTLRGSVKVKGVEPKAAAVDAAKWTAFHAPGAGVSVTANEADTRVFFAVVGRGEPIAEVVVELRGKAPKRLAWKTRPAKIEAIDLSASKDLAWTGGAMHARIGFEGESQKASLEILMGSKDAPIAQHVHDASWEILAALRADGAIERDDKADSPAPKPSRVTDGVVVAIPKGAPHAWQPGGSKPLVAVQLYVPPGPEQRFKALAAQ